MVRSNNNYTTKKRVPLTGGFLSKFRRAIRSHTQKLTNKIPLSYIARFRKMYPEGEITGTGYKYLIMGIGDNNLLALLAKEYKANLPNDTVVNSSLTEYKSTLNYSLRDLIPIDTISKEDLNKLEIKHKLIEALYSKYKIAYISKTGNNIIVTQYPDTKIPIANYSYSGIRIFIYKPLSESPSEIVSETRKLVSSRSRSRRSSRRSSRSRLSSQVPNQ